MTRWPLSGPPVVLLLARKHGMSAKLLLLALAFAVTIGSVASPIGNPQNLLIALVGALPILVGSSRRGIYGRVDGACGRQHHRGKSLYTGALGVSEASVGE